MTGDGLPATGHPTPHQAESQGCLMVVAAHTDLAPALESVVDDTTAWIMTSPTLGDFIEPRFVDLGPRPRAAADLAGAAARIAAALTRPGRQVERVHFALVIADYSAGAIEEIVRACAADPVIAALPVRCRGLAVVEDRADPAAESPAVPGPAVAVVVAPTGAWGRRELTGELHRYAGGLLHDIATARHPGLSRAELDSIRARDSEILFSLPADWVPGRAAPGEPAGPAPADLAPPDPAPADPDGHGKPWREHPPAAPSAGPGASGEMAGTDPSEPGDAEADCPVPVLLVVTWEEGSGTGAGLTRALALLSELDGKLAALSRPAYLVRALLNGEAAPAGRLGEAAQLSRRDVKRLGSDTDFARTLTTARALMRRDLATLARAGAPDAGPAVVLLPAEPPLADAVTMRVYAELTRDVPVIWLLPRHSADLLSPAFAVPGATIVTDHPGAADEVTSLIQAATGFLTPLETP